MPGASTSALWLSVPLSWRVTKHESDDYYTQVRLGTTSLTAGNFD